MFVYLVSYAKGILHFEKPTVLLAWKHLNTMVLNNFENLNSISNNHDFLVLTELVIICIYLRTTDKHFRDQENVCHPTSELLKCDLVQTNLSKSIFADFYCRKGISYFQFSFLPQDISLNVEGKIV